MSGQTVALLVVALAMAVAGWFVFVLALRAGQFKDVEATKHQIFEEES